MYFDPGYSYGPDHPDFIYTSQLVIDYNEDVLYDPTVISVDNEQPTFKMMTMKVDMHDLQIVYKKYYTMDMEQQKYLRDLYKLDDTYMVDG